MREIIEEYLETLDDEKDTEEFGTEKDIAGAILKVFLNWYSALEIDRYIIQKLKEKDV